MSIVTLRLHRGSPGGTEPSRFVTYEVPLAAKMTVLDAVARVQRTQAPDLAYRYACRVGMCGTCGMVINGRERWACRTLVESLGAEITVEPLRNMPVVKDLVVDMAPFFGAMSRAMAHFAPEPAEPAAAAGSAEPAASRPQPDGSDWANIADALKQRPSIDPHIECITCGLCYSSCTVISWDPEYLGPAALNRAATLVKDPRDEARAARLAVAGGEHGCWRCHSQFTCTDVCPMQLRPTASIGYLKRQYIAESVKDLFGTRSALVPAPREAAPPEAPVGRAGRREFLRYAAGGAIAAVAAGLATGVSVYLGGPRSAEAAEGAWTPVGPADQFASGEPREIILPPRSGEAGGGLATRLYVVREADGTLAALSPECTHLGCAVHWDGAIRQFVCPCHGGAFTIDGQVAGGPPPRPLDRLAARVESGQLQVREA